MTGVEVSSTQESSSQERERASFFHPFFDVVRERDHAHSLPDAEAYTGGDTTVKALHAVLLIDESKGIENRQLGRSVHVSSSLGH